MADEITSVAVLDALPGKEEELLTTLRNFYGLMQQKGYSRDALHRDVSRGDRFVNLRRWRSPEMRAEAQADPDVHYYWQKLPELCLVKVLYESLEEVFET